MDYTINISSTTNVSRRLQTGASVKGKVWLIVSSCPFAVVGDEKGSKIETSLLAIGCVPEKVADEDNKCDHMAASTMPTRSSNIVNGLVSLQIVFLQQTIYLMRLCRNRFLESGKPQLQLCVSVKHAKMVAPSSAHNNVVHLDSFA